jgi:hypothetical protein
VPECFFSLQLAAQMGDVAGRSEIELECSVFEDPKILVAVLEYLNRRLDDGVSATLRTMDLKLTKEQWKLLCEAEKFVFGACDRSPFWSGLAQRHVLVSGSGTEHSVCITASKVTVVCPGLSLVVELDRHAPLPCKIPEGAIDCKLDGESVPCRGELRECGYLRVKSCSRAFFWFDIAVERVPAVNCDLVYME